ncbi:hypothetical protein [Labilibaculum sp.]|uniref:hypothetical protein n=1 Tax=Labilibaculum sp. TaxID=2060723 RepID=UPI003564069F
MNNLLYKKRYLAGLLLGSLFLFSCGSSSGDEEEVDFDSSDLTNQYWYANPYLSSGYSYDDAVIVCRFESGGILKRQEFSGRRDEVAGSWTLVDDELVIRDTTISESNEQDWFIQSSSTASYLKLNSESGTREFYTNIDDLEDVTADAYVVNELYIVDGVFQSAYKMEYVVYGSSLSEVTVLPDASTSLEMEDFTDYLGEKVFYLKEEDRYDYFDVFEGASEVKFYLKTDDGDQYKLEEQVYDSVIPVLDNYSITSSHSVGSSSITINWTAIDEGDIYYYVEILDQDENEYQPMFRSTRQSASAGEAKTLTIDSSTASEYENLDDLVVGEDYYVKISGFKYEDGIDADNSSNKEENIQAVSRYIFKAGSW